ncbi:hypothetical protein ACQ86N_02480 [Puia sp. P3]|uniref:hypothetical protein n=1 Tax=Puia sp. P3 TaxID=3423952 RepID=UPI003D67C6BF
MNPSTDNKEPRWLRVWADDLNRSVNKLAPRTLMILSVASFIAIASLMVVMLIKPPKSNRPLIQQAIRTPAYIMDSMGTSMEEIRRQTVLRHLNSLLHQLDSLQANPVTRSRYDSLVRVHPNLRDSLLRAQQLFLQPLTVTP